MIGIYFFSDRLKESIEGTTCLAKIKNPQMSTWFSQITALGSQDIYQRQQFCKITNVIAWKIYKNDVMYIET